MAVPIQKMLDFSGKTVIVTGGRAGLGSGIAKRFAETGANVVITYRTEDPAHPAAEVVAEIEKRGARGLAIRTDVRDAARSREMIAKAAEVFGRVDMLVNNAGIYPHHDLLTVGEAEWDDMHQSNLRGAFFCAQAAANQMIRQGTGGAIVNILSINAFRPDGRPGSSTAPPRRGSRWSRAAWPSSLESTASASTRSRRAHRRARPRPKRPRLAGTLQRPGPSRADRAARRHRRRLHLLLQRALRMGDGRDHPGRRRRHARRGLLEKEASMNDYYSLKNRVAIVTGGGQRARPRHRPALGPARRVRHALRHQRIEPAQGGPRSSGWRGSTPPPATAT